MEILDNYDIVEIENNGIKYEATFTIIKENGKRKIQFSGIVITSKNENDEEISTFQIDVEKEIQDLLVKAIKNKQVS